MASYMLINYDHLKFLGKIVDHNSAQYGWIQLIGYFNSETTKKHIENVSFEQFGYNQPIFKIPINLLVLVV